MIRELGLEGAVVSGGTAQGTEQRIDGIRDQTDNTRDCVKSVPGHSKPKGLSRLCKRAILDVAIAACAGSLLAVGAPVVPLSIFTGLLYAANEELYRK